MSSHLADARIWVNGELKTRGRRASSIGRDPQADIPVEIHPKVSGRHGSLRFAADGWHYRDEGSRNGSFLEGQRVTESCSR